MKIAPEKMDLEDDDTIDCDYAQCQKPACLVYVNSQGIAK
jgi:hypothetical protein